VKGLRGRAALLCLLLLLPLILLLPLCPDPWRTSPPPRGSVLTQPRGAAHPEYTIVLFLVIVLVLVVLE
jgi:hypothetical protein